MEILFVFFGHFYIHKWSEIMVESWHRYGNKSVCKMTVYSNYYCLLLLLLYLWSFAICHTLPLAITTRSLLMASSKFLQSFSNCLRLIHCRSSTGESRWEDHNRGITPYGSVSNWRTQALGYLPYGGVISSREETSSSGDASSTISGRNRQRLHRHPNQPYSFGKIR